MSPLIVHVSHPYNSVDHVQHFRTRILTAMSILLYIGTLFINANVDFAIPIFFSHLTAEVNRLPRTYSRSFPWTVMLYVGCTVAFGNTMVKDFVLFR